MKSAGYATRQLTQALASVNGIGLVDEVISVEAVTSDGRVVERSSVPRSASSWIVKDGVAKNASRIEFPPSGKKYTVAGFVLSAGGETLYRASAKVSREIMSGDAIVIHPGQLVVEER